MTGKLAAAHLLGLALAAASAGAAGPSPPAAGRFMRQLDESSWVLRAEALQYLADHQVRAAIAPARAIAEDEASPPWVRGRALVALCKIDPGEGPQQLVVDFATAPAAGLRAAAAEALERYTDVSAKGLATRLLADADPAVRYRALAALAHIDRAAAWPVVDPLTRDPARAVRPLAARALAWAGTDEALARLASLAADRGTAAATLRAIADIPDPQLVPIYLQMLEPEDPEGATFAALVSALAKHDGSAVAAALRAALGRGEEATTLACARVITRLTQAPELGAALATALAEAQGIQTLKAGLTALGCAEMKPDAHREFFARFLAHADPDLRILAIRCLAHCESVNLFDALAPLITDEHTDVRFAALGALLRAPAIQAPSGRLVAYLEPTLISTDEGTRKLGFELLGHAGSADDFQPALAMLGDALRGTDSKRREAVAAALGSIAPEDGIAPVARSQGYISDWMVVGTFLNDKDHGGFAKEFEPEKEIDFEATYPSTYVWALNSRQRNDNEKPIEREVGWTAVAVDRTDGKLRLGPLLPPPGTFSVAYAVADFTVPAEREVIMNIDGDDAFRVWLNGEEIAKEIAPFQHNQSCTASKLGMEFTLAPGVNRLLAKSANIDGDWWIRVRLTDSGELPVEVRKP